MVEKSDSRSPDQILESLRGRFEAFITTQVNRVWVDPKTVGEESKIDDFYKCAVCLGVVWDA
jgi:hypothetical protein